VIYCASQSPQRAMLLRQAGVTFTVVPSTGDEETVAAAHPQRLAIERAQVKARGAVLPAVAPGAGPADGVILGADTVVALGTTVFGKPADDADARRILRCLQGTTHSVLTGHHAIVVRGGMRGAEASGLSVARVTMRSMTDADIDAYIATGEHRGRAGAYAIQETGDRFVIDVEGSWGTVVGLSITTVAKLVRELTDAPLPMTGGDASTTVKTRLFSRRTP
jgi:septum formation protein